MACRRIPRISPWSVLPGESEAVHSRWRVLLRRSNIRYSRGSLRHFLHTRFWRASARHDSVSAWHEYNLGEDGGSFDCLQDLSVGATHDRNASGVNEADDTTRGSSSHTRRAPAAVGPGLSGPGGFWPRPRGKATAVVRKSGRDAFRPGSTSAKPAATGRLLATFGHRGKSRGDVRKRRDAESALAYSSA
jgi:hypothetical protein